MPLRKINSPNSYSILFQALLYLCIMLCSVQTSVIDESSSKLAGSCFLVESLLRNICEQEAAHENVHSNKLVCEEMGPFSR